MNDLPLFDPLRGHNLPEVEAFVARMIIGADKEQPIMIAEIQKHLSRKFNREFTVRAVKDVIRELRQTHYLPIGSSKGARPRKTKKRKADQTPAGYWWIETADEMKVFAEEFAAQPYDQLKTLSRLVRRNQPELIGQLQFALPEIEDISPCCR